MNDPLPPAALSVRQTLAANAAATAPLLGSLLLLTLLFCAPNGWLEWRDGELLAAGAKEHLTPWWLGLAVALATDTVLQGMASGLALRRIAEAPASVVEAFALPLAALGGLLTVAIATAALAVVGVGLPGLLYTALPNVGTLLLFGAGSVGVLIVSAGWLLAVPVLLAERRAPFAALARSWRLTEGVRGKCFLLRALQGVFVVASTQTGALFGDALGAYLLRVPATALLLLLPTVAYLRLLAAREEPLPPRLEELFR